MNESIWVQHIQLNNLIETVVKIILTVRTMEPHWCYYVRLPIYCWCRHFLVCFRNCLKTFHIYAVCHANTKKRSLRCFILHLFLHGKHIYLFLLWARTQNTNYFSSKQHIGETVMNLAKKFEEATSCVTTNISSLVIEKTYPIVHAKRITTKYGPTVLLNVRDSESSVVQIFTPKRHCSVISDMD